MKRINTKCKVLNFIIFKLHYNKILFYTYRLDQILQPGESELAWKMNFVQKSFYEIFKTLHFDVKLSPILNEFMEKKSNNSLFETQDPIIPLVRRGTLFLIFCFYLTTIN